MLGLAAFLTGCGLSDYEANMASEQARVHRLDEENKYLDDPVEWPARKEGDKKDTGKKDVDKNYVEVFFRPPRGISRKPNAKQHGTLYVFPRSDNGSLLEIEIGTAVTTGDFGNDVRRLFVPAGKEAPWNDTEKSVPGRIEPLAFRTTTFDEAGATYSINIYKKGNMQVAVVYHLDKGKSSDTTTKMELSLESLAIDAEAAQERRRFGLYHTKAPGI
jgi:hypothetical protein